MIPYLYFLMAIIGVAFFIVLLMIFDAVFNDLETGPAARLVYEYPEDARVPGRSRSSDA